MSGKNAQNLSPEEKEERINLINSIIAGVAEATGDDASMASIAGKIEAENNQYNNNYAVHRNEHKPGEVIPCESSSGYCIVTDQNLEAHEHPILGGDPDVYLTQPISDEVYRQLVSLGKAEIRYEDPDKVIGDLAVLGGAMFDNNCMAYALCALTVATTGEHPIKGKLSEEERLDWIVTAGLTTAGTVGGGVLIFKPGSSVKGLAQSSQGGIPSSNKIIDGTAVILNQAEKLPNGTVIPAGSTVISNANNNVIRYTTAGGKEVTLDYSSAMKAPAASSPTKAGGGATNSTGNPSTGTSNSTTTGNQGVSQTPSTGSMVDSSIPNAGRPVDRHYFDKIKQGSVTKSNNTVIDKGVDVNADIAAIRNGDGVVSGKTVTVNNRTYGFHENGRLYPISGEGFTTLDRGVYSALGIYKQFGNSPRAVQILDNMGIQPSARQQALEVWQRNQ